jgi:hypothetical protein
MADIRASATPLDDAQYISLRTFKRDGSAVDTPVWAAPLDGTLIVFTLRDSYKVKRIQRTPKVQIARCDVRGGLEGPWYDATCRALDRGTEHEARAYAALTEKYGLKMRIGNVFSTLSGRRGRRVVLEISLAPQ